MKPETIKNDPYVAVRDPSRRRGKFTQPGTLSFAELCTIMRLIRMHIFTANEFFPRSEKLPLP